MRRAFTLVELIAAMTVLSIVAAVAAPLILSSADSYGSAVSVRRAADRNAFAIDRVVRMLRESPSVTPGGPLDLTSADTNGITFADGSGLSLSGSELLILDAGGDSSVLIQGVTAFTIQYLAEDGRSDLSATPALAHRFRVTLAADGFESRVDVFPRVRASG